MLFIIERDDAGAIKAVYANPSAIFQEALTYDSTGRLKERLPEYPHMMAEAALRFGADADAQRDEILAAWPEEKPDDDPELLAFLATVLNSEGRA